MAKSGDFHGHQRRPQLAITGYFFVATDISAPVWEDHGFVFTNAIGRPIDSSNLRRIVSGHAESAGVGHLSPNELRHSAASLLVASGTPLQDVSDMLGHRDIRMLAQTYRHKLRPIVDVTAGQDRMFGEG